MYVDQMKIVGYIENLKKLLNKMKKESRMIYKEEEFYWDYVNGIITKDSNFAKIIPNLNEFYIEQYELYNGIRINFTYSILEKEKIYSLFQLRKSFFELHQIIDNEIKKLVYLYIPYSIYRSILNYDDFR